MEPNGRPLASALSLYFAILATGMVAFAGASLSESDSPVWQFLMQGMDALLVAAWMAVGWKRLGPIVRSVSRPGWYLAAVFIGCVTFALAHGLVTLLERVFSTPSFSYSDEFLSAGFGWWVVILSISIQPAVVEELAFRGVILEGLRGVLSVRDAVIVSAFLFMVIHLAALSFPHLLVIGLTLGYLRIRTGSMYPGMVAHAVHNSLCLASEWYAAGGSTL